MNIDFIPLTVWVNVWGWQKIYFFHRTDSPSSHIQMVTLLPKHNTQLYEYVTWQQVKYRQNVLSFWNAACLSKRKQKENRPDFKTIPVKKNDIKLFYNQYTLLESLKSKKHRALKKVAW